MVPSGLWGMKGSSLLAFGEKRRKTEVSTPLLYYRAKRVWNVRRFGGRSAAESVNLPVPLCPLRQVFRHRSGCGDAGCMPGVHTDAKLQINGKNAVEVIC